MEKENQSTCCNSGKSKKVSTKEHTCCSDVKEVTEKSNRTEEKSAQEKSCH